MRSETLFIFEQDKKFNIFNRLERIKHFSSILRKAEYIPRLPEALDGPDELRSREGKHDIASGE